MEDYTGHGVKVENSRVGRVQDKTETQTEGEEPRKRWDEIKHWFFERSKNSVSND